MLSCELKRILGGYHILTFTYLATQEHQYCLKPINYVCKLLCIPKIYILERRKVVTYAQEILEKNRTKVINRHFDKKNGKVETCQEKSFSAKYATTKM